MGNKISHLKFCNSIEIDKHVVIMMKEFLFENCVEDSIKNIYLFSWKDVNIHISLEIDSVNLNVYGFRVKIVYREKIRDCYIFVGAWLSDGRKMFLFDECCPPIFMCELFKIFNFMKKNEIKEVVI